MKKLFISIFATITFLFSVNSQEKDFEKVSIDKLISETQFSSDNMDYIEFVWWVPTEYWEVVFSQDPTTTDAQSQEIIKIIEEYVIVIALKGKIGIFGGITYDDEDTIKSQLRVKYNNKLLKLLKNNEIDPDTKNFITLMKPMIAGMLGEMGDNMQFYLFKPNEPIDVYKKGELEFELGDFVSTNNLPLGSLLEEKKCPQTNKLHNGKWKYCPFHGDELIQKK